LQAKGKILQQPIFLKCMHLFLLVYWISMREW